MTGKVVDLRMLSEGDVLAESVAELFNDWNSQRAFWLDEQSEKRNFLFATDTTKTSNSTLPWKNSTTLPKLTQIRDNLHANYMAALFPNDQWLKWEAYTQDAALKEKRDAIEAYMSNKVRESSLQETASKLVYDYIDYGNAICEIIFVNETKEDIETGELIPGYIGPKLIRISPLDIVFNPTAPSFEETPKIRRIVKSFGELLLERQENPEAGWIDEALKKSQHIRNMAGSFTADDFDKAEGYIIDGFGSLKQYYQSNFVEILELTGDIYDPDTETFLKDHVITIIDRRFVVRKQKTPTWLSKGTMYHVGWRGRPDNLYAMGPLDNLVGMQYRIDHLENLKADVFDFIAFPPLKIIGEVKEFVWAPGAEIHIDEGGDVQMLRPDATALNADFQINLLQQQMEEFAGAPKEAMGIRTPGEKTAFEVQSLQNAAGRIFQEKIINFEMMLEKALNAMLEVARRNFEGSDTVRVLDDDLGVEQFIKITKDDITASGKLRPIGARHFAVQAQLIQNLTGIFNSSLGQVIAPHISTKKLARLVESLFKVERFELVEDNIGIIEQLETQGIIQQGGEDLEVERTVDETLQQDTTEIL